MSDRTGPLPQWTPIDLVAGVYEATGDGGRAWRLRAVYDSDQVDARPVRYLLAPHDGLTRAETITAEHGLYFALDIAGMRIASEAVSADPGRARQQMGLGDGGDHV